MPGRKLLAAMLASAAIALPARSHVGATGVVKERMEVMEALGRQMKAINARIRRKMEAAAIKKDAAAIATSAAHIPHLYPAGSAHGPTEAKATIWQNFADFERKAKALEEESNKLAATDAEDFRALELQARAVSRTCSACHESYRMKN